MHRGWPPPFWSAFFLALATTVSLAGYVLELVGHPSQGLRIAASSFVILVLVLLAVWYWGFSRGRNTKDWED
jgi:hypothetical protein